MKKSRKHSLTTKSGKNIFEINKTILLKNSTITSKLGARNRRSYQRDRFRSTQGKINPSKIRSGKKSKIVSLKFKLGESMKKNKPQEIKLKSDLHSSQKKSTQKVDENSNRLSQIKNGPLTQPEDKKAESTKIPPEKTSIQHSIKWELNADESWDKIEQNLIFGQCIGEGSFSRVYDGYDKILDKAVAIKVIKKKRFKTEKKRRVVQLEVEILSKMVHPNIVRFKRLLEDHKRVK